MLLLLEKGIRGGICHSVHRYVKANNKFIQYYDKNKESSYILYWDVNNFNGWAMLKKLPVITLFGSKMLLNLMKIPQGTIMKKVIKDFS